MGKDACATCCAIFSLIGIVHLVVFGMMFANGAVSFAIPSIERAWDTQEKARACYNGAIIYTVFFLVSALARVYFRRNEAATRLLQHTAHMEEVQALLSPPSPDSDSGVNVRPGRGY
ncbi:hypothetical protein AGDE_04199 [Angomonas deanei]|uniref:Uncharacterized protein n=1 Tax=Angomonas deanei TaxID=59799 RepID=A0A7G2CR76_9TRYP|nr:hypothetical protein AGDE_04199 [Angomonas deanei]CAD2222318.1 hypothetical protein, conserved [Angomonas deanei]|eukprot:EPY39729.1 hypothetical protein AGDE_04199 [Angomonas deanei]